MPMTSSPSAKLFQVVNSEPGDPKGRKLVASTNIDVGKCILQEEAYAWVLNTENIQERCACCSALPPPLDAALSRCSRCHTACYINRTHQQKAWKAGHREECPILAAAAVAREEGAEEKERKKGQPKTTTPPTIFRLALRVILNAYKAGKLHLMAIEDSEACIDTTFEHKIEEPCGFSGVLSLLSHWENIGGTEGKEINDTTTTIAAQAEQPTCSTQNSTPLLSISNNAKIEFAHLAAWLHSILQTTHPEIGKITTPKQIAFLLSRLSCNAHSICDDELRVIGLGIYPLTAMANHSCEPTCVQTFGKNGRVALRMVKPVCAGQELTIAYVELAAVRWERRQQLLDSHCFDIDTPTTCTSVATGGAVPGKIEKQQENENKVEKPEPRVLKDQQGNLIHHFHHPNSTFPPWKYDPRDIQLTGLAKSNSQSITSKRAVKEKEEYSSIGGAWGQIREKNDRINRIKGFDVDAPVDDTFEEDELEESKKQEPYIEIYTWSGDGGGGGNGSGGGGGLVADERLDSFVISYSEALRLLKEPHSTSKSQLTCNNTRLEKLKSLLTTLTSNSSSSSETGMLLGSRHILRLRLLAALLHAFIESGDQWNEALCIAKELLPLYEFIYPSPKWPPLVLHVATLAKLEDFVGDPGLARAYAKRALLLMEGIVEPGSPACTEMERLLYMTPN